MLETAETLPSRDAALDAPMEASTEASTEAPAPSVVKGGVVAYLQIDGAMKAADFYGRAFAATVESALPPDEQGRTCHVHLYVNGSSLMLADPFPEHGCPREIPQGFNLTLLVDDIEAWFARAVEAGCTAVMPVSEMFWGDLYGQVRDPFGVLWAMNQPKR